MPKLLLSLNSPLGVLYSSHKTQKLFTYTKPYFIHMSDNIVEINSEEELEDTIEDNEQLLVDFYADWCGPCKMMESTIEEVSEEHELTVAEIDIDENQHIAAQYGVRSVPTYILYEDEEPVEQMIGYQEKEEMVSHIED